MQAKMMRAALVTLGLSMVLGPRPAVAQVDASGTWALEVTTDNGVTTPTLTLEQEGATLSGHYSSEALGETDVTGTVDGSDVVVTFTASLQGQPIGVSYRGSIDGEGVWTGTIDIADGMLTGSFRGTRR